MGKKYRIRKGSPLDITVTVVGSILIGFAYAMAIVGLGVLIK